MFVTHIIQKDTFISRFIFQKFDTVHVNYPILITIVCEVKFTAEQDFELIF